ncbi:MAG: DUF3999 family protein [Cellvibrio sp.]|uniref:DUF3999 family protein n=1 Tax=Cellvibrio sp. TaxID=1965322 RepID=UPI0031A938E1
MKCVNKYLSVGGLLLGLGAWANADVIPVYQIKDTAETYLQTTITHDIYRYSSSIQLNDVVVTDKEGNKLPYRITPPSTQSSEQSHQKSVRFFPVAVGVPPEIILALSSASIRLDDNGISVSAEKTTNTELQEQTAPIDFYVVDLSELRERADKLIVNWQVNETNQYLEVQVSGTNDLTNWAPLAQGTLAQLQKDGERLTSNKLTLNIAEKQYAYLRLKFTRGGEKLELTDVHVENTDRIPNIPPADIWNVNGELADEQDSALRSADLKSTSVAAWEFTREDISPLNAVSLDLGTTAYGDSIKVFSRSSEKKSWQLVHQGVWFNAQVGSEWQHSNPISLQAASEAHWRIEFNEQVRKTLKPSLVFHRQPQHLQFIANNAAPYNISIDDQAAPDNQQNNLQIFSQLLSNKEAKWTQVKYEELNPSISSFARHATVFSWKTILFWVVLLAAVGALVFVAVRLVGQMKNHTESPQ